MGKIPGGRFFYFKVKVGVKEANCRGGTRKYQESGGKRQLEGGTDMGGHEARSLGGETTVQSVLECKLNGCPG